MAAKLTREEFINRCVLIFGNEYNYSKVIYTGMFNKVIIDCSVHGEFLKTPHDHVRGRGCTECSNIKVSKSLTCTTNQFIEKAIKKHGGKYDYSLVDYKTSEDRITIICPIHGKTEQVPIMHIRGFGCNECGKNVNRINQSRTQEDFIKNAQLKHNFKYTYNNVKYINSKIKIIINCEKHGNFLQTPSNHLHGKGCKKCGSEKLSLDRRFTKDSFIARSQIIHDNKYNYPNITYINCETKVQIECIEHGIFMQTPSSHLRGVGCPSCSLEFNNNNKESWIKRGKNKEGIFYIIRCWNEEEWFYKLGITYRSVKRRYPNNHFMPYNYEIIREVKSMNLEYIWDLEKRFKRTKKLNYYLPKIYFNGHKTECFK